jgi:proliferating cell nuclear antigen
MDDLYKNETSIFYFKTVQSNAIKVLLDSLKDILDDTVIRIDSEGFKIITMDGTKAVIVHLKLNADSFEEFECKEPTTIALNIPHIHRFLKTIANNDVLTFMLTEEDPHVLKIIIENESRNKVDLNEINLKDINERAIHIPAIEFDSVSRISSNEFQKYCRDLSIISDTVEIKIENDKFSMFSEGDLGKKRIILGETEGSLSFDKSSDEKVSGIFSLNFLSLFARSSNLCSELQLFLKNDKPMVLLYPIADLGSLKYVLASERGPDDME